ncbi:hypothetical protein AX15_005593 [Amanita polypyramis BW_CC]|nr:hypothetical protein AX15_005593 [Amanita polypyramis BW_CC]
MHFSRIALFVLPVLAAANPIAPRNDGPSCSTGPVQCCNSVQTVGSLTAPVTLLLGLLGINIGSLTGLVGVGCVNIASTGCSSQVVCCQNNNFSGLVSLGCNNISL